MDDRTVFALEIHATGRSFSRMMSLRYTAHCPALVGVAAVKIPALMFDSVLAVVAYWQTKLKMMPSATR